MIIPSEFPDLDDSNSEIKAVDRAGADMNRFVQSQQVLDDLFSPYREVLEGRPRTPSGVTYSVPLVPSDPLAEMMDETDDGAMAKFGKVEDQRPDSPHFHAVTRMVAGMRARPVFSRIKDNPRWAELVVDALDYVESAK
ncbi:MAG: hypothetical protein ACRD3P_17700 [Terriglobales bacterium]